MAQLAAGNDFGTAVITGKSFEKAAGNFFPTSTGNIANAQSDNLYSLEQGEYNQLSADVANARQAIDVAEEELAEQGIHTDEEPEVHEDRAKKLHNEAEELRKQAEEKFDETDRIRFFELSKMDSRSKAEQYEFEELARRKAEFDAAIAEAEEEEREAALEEEKAALIKKRNKALERYAILANRKESFFTADAIKKRMQIRRSGASKKELKSAGDEILRLILEAKLMRKKGPESMTHNETLDDDTLESASDSREFIANTLALAVKKHSNVDLDELISRATDLDPSDEVYEELKEQMEKYLTELRKDEVASAWRDSSKYGATAGNMDSEMAESIIAGLQNGKLHEDEN